MNKEQQIEEMAREIAKRSCHLFESCPKPIKHNCISQNPEIMLESSKNYITIAIWLYNAGYRKESETAKNFGEKLKARKQWFLSGDIENDHFNEQIDELLKEFGVEIDK